MLFLTDCLGVAYIKERIQDLFFFFERERSGFCDFSGSNFMVASIICIYSANKTIMVHAEYFSIVNRRITPDYIEGATMCDRK